MFLLRLLRAACLLALAAVLVVTAHLWLPSLIACVAFYHTLRRFGLL